MTTMTAIPAYEGKPQRYFSGARKAFVDDLPAMPQGRLLEIGCGNGDTAAYALATGKCGWCAGVELCPEPAEEARTKMNEVVVGDVEVTDLPFEQKVFDALILSEVVEHLRDPWETLRRLHPFLKRGAWVLAGSPNVAHHSVLRMLLRGGWDLEPSGIMDRTHLRWFTPSTYAKLFEDCGFEAVSTAPADPLRWKARCFNTATGRLFQYLLHPQIYLKARRR